MTSFQGNILESRQIYSSYSKMIDINLTYLPSLGQCTRQKYNCWLSPKSLSVLYRRNVRENRGHSNRLWTVCNKDSIYTSLPTIPVVVSWRHSLLSKCWMTSLNYLVQLDLNTMNMLIIKKKSKVRRNISYVLAAKFNVI